MGQLQFTIDSMNSRRCVREVTARLRDVPGVETVSANQAERTVLLTGSMRLEDVLDALTRTDLAPSLDHLSSEDA